MFSGKLISTIIGFCAMTLVSCADAEMNEEAFGKLFDNYLKSEKGQQSLAGAMESYIQRKQGEARKQQEQQASADIESQFKNPVQIAAGESPFKGPAGAKITIIEFSDFQCPFCKRGKETMEAVLAKYPKDVKVVFKQLPLPFHDKAMPAAQASLAAAKQGKFWEMHDEFFANQSQLGPDYYVKVAEKLGLNIEKFKADMASAEIKKAVEEDMALAKKHGIQGTPGFFVNGVAVKGAYPVDHFAKIIDRWLSGNPAQEKK